MLSSKELVDVIAPDGAWTGETKTIAQVHANGDWHACVHGVITDGAGHVLMQHRGPGAGVLPNAWDCVSTGGHITALTPQERDNPFMWDLLSQAWRALVREAKEELGLDLSGHRPFTDDVVMFGVTRTDQPIGDGGYDRTLNVNFMIRLPDLDTSKLTLEPDKVLAVRWVRANAIDPEHLLIKGKSEEQAERWPDHYHLVDGATSCALRMIVAEDLDETPKAGS